MEVKDYRAINSPEDINWALFLTSCKLWVLALPEKGQEMFYFDKWETLGDALLRLGTLLVGRVWEFLKV